MLFAILSWLDCSAAHADPSVSLAADAELKNRCADDYERAQRRRMEGDLVMAQRHALACAQRECPEVLSRDCTRWAVELERSVPTVALQLFDAEGQSVSDPVFSIDGEPQDLQAAGRGLKVNPGKRTFVGFGRGIQTVPTTRLVVEGVKNQLVVLRLPGDPNLQQAARFELPLVSSILGGVAILGAGSFAYFGIQGRRGKSELESDCAPRCPRERGDPIRRDFLIADVSLGVAAVSLSLAVWWAFDANSGTSASGRSLSVAVAPRSAMVVWQAPPF